MKTKTISILGLSLSLLFGDAAHSADSITSPNADANSLPAAATNSFGPDEQAKHAAGLQSFLDAKFGVFIHFGLYSVPAGEWKGNKGYAEWFQIETEMPLSEYSKFATQFNPVKFDAKKWVKNIKNAGIKYIVVTTKHHDGFAMYDTKLEDYNVVQATPWHHDPMKDLAAACQEAGIKLCFYYSLPDWHSSDFPQKYSQYWGDKPFHGNPNPDADIEKYVSYMKGQIHEILTQYGPIGALWFDDGGAFHGLNGEQRAQLIHAQEIVDEVHQLQPGCVIDDRLGLPGDYGTPEQVIPAGFPDKPFETCMPLNHHWGYNKNDHDWKSPQTIIQQLAAVASKGGNYLLGIGAMPDGIFPPPEAEATLEPVGNWLKINGESIYGTQAGPLHTWRWGCTTQKGDKLYLHVFHWPQDGELLVPIQNEVKRAWLLADAKQTALAVTASESGATISLPAQAPDVLDTVVAVEISDPSHVVTVPAGKLNLAEDKPVEVSSFWPGREDLLNKSHITDGKEETSWAAEESARTAWITVDLQTKQKISCVMLSDAPFGRTQAFNVEAQINGVWTKITEGTKIGEDSYLTFSPVKARFFRLNILKASDTPTLAEFQLFEK